MNGIELIAAERQRQIEQEGWTSEHDREHGGRLLFRAAMAYQSGDPRMWPFELASWKPKNALEDLIRAGALYQASADVEEHEYFRACALRERDRCARLIDELRVAVERMWPR